MSYLDFHPLADAELEALWDVNEDAAALIDTLLIQLEENPALLDHLCIENRYLNTEPSFEVKRFQHVWRQNYMIYILKITDVDGQIAEYRVIYAHHPQKDIYYVLAVMDRKVDYESDRNFIDRICEAYENYGIPRY